MKTSQKNPDKPVMDEVDDLTRFLDEDFGTEEVNLFEFTSEQDSPLTQLKSIILSLDWEISDEILQDLTDEINHLKHLEQFESDKVSQVYLQGLDKIGHYIQAEGAYAHPNSIKLLLTLYYDFEKILSSEHITGAEITALLKADVRKFKILQHQIAQKHGAAAAKEVSAPLPLTEHKDLQGVQAAILELDWEVTDKGLANLTDQLNILKERYTEDRFIQVVIQGLHSLNTYITEERGRAHPETFSLLHNFYDALEALVEKPDLEEEKRQEILIDSVNRLNNLKHLIAQTYPQEVVEAEAISPVAEPGEPALKEFGIKPEPAAKTEEISVPKEKPSEASVPAEPVFREEAKKKPVPAAEEDIDEIGIFGTDMDEHREIAPALSDSMEEAGFAMSGEAETPSDELSEKLDFFFGEEKEEFTPETIEQSVARKAEEKLPIEPAAPVVFEEEIAPALAGSFEEQGFGAEGGGLQAPTRDLADKLDFFFGDEAKKPAEEEAAPVTAPAEAEEKEPALTFTAEPEEALAGFDAEEIAPALADQGEDVGFGGRGAHLEAPPEELAEKLDFFFGADEEKGMAPPTEATVQAPPALEEEPAITFAAEPEEEGAVAFMAESVEEISPALADFGEETGFAGKEMEAQPEGLAEKLDFFFGPEETAPAAEMPGIPEAEPEEEEVLLTPALAAAAEEEIPAYGEIASPAEYQAALRQMRSEFKEMEMALKEQIEGLRRDVQSLQSLRAQLKS